MSRTVFWKIVINKSFCLKEYSVCGRTFLIDEADMKKEMRCPFCTAIIVDKARGSSADHEKENGRRVRIRCFQRISK